MSFGDFIKPHIDQGHCQKMPLSDCHTWTPTIPSVFPIQLSIQQLNRRSFDQKPSTHLLLILFDIEPHPAVGGHFVEFDRRDLERLRVRRESRAHDAFPFSAFSLSLYSLYSTLSTRASQLAAMMFSLTP